MSDYISRQDAIDVIQAIERLATLPDNDAVIKCSEVEYVLYHLPPVHSSYDRGWKEGREALREEMRKGADDE